MPVQAVHSKNRTVQVLKSYRCLGHVGKVVKVLEHYFSKSCVFKSICTTKCISQCRLPNGGHFVTATINHFY